jgi:hypothetical protein
LKNFLFFASLAVIVAGTVAAGQQTASVQPIVYTAQSASFSPNEIKAVGTIDNGQTTTVSEIPSSSQYRALVFEGFGHDQVEITVAGGARRAYVALADSTLMPIASGMGRLVTNLPYHGPDREAFYILIKGSPNQRLTVHLKQSSATSARLTTSEATR